MDDDQVQMIKMILAKSLSLVVLKTKDPSWDEKQAKHVQLDTIDPKNKFEVIQALKDDRSISKLK